LGTRPWSSRCRPGGRSRSHSTWPLGASATRSRFWKVRYDAIERLELTMEAGSRSATRSRDAIRLVEAIPIQLPLRRDWKWRGMNGELGRWVVVRICTDDGLTGYGEATPLPDWGGDFHRYSGETPETVVHVVRDLLAPTVVGLDPFDLQIAETRMDSAVR